MPIRRKLGAAIFAAVVAGGLAWAVWPISAYLRFKEPVDDWRDIVIFRDDTTASQQFSEDGFRMIRVGDESAKVRQTLGDPLVVETHEGIDVWRYTKSANSGSFFQRDLWLREGRVIEVYSKHYID